MAKEKFLIRKKIPFYITAKMILIIVVLTKRAKIAVVQINILANKTSFLRKELASLKFKIKIIR